MSKITRSLLLTTNLFESYELWIKEIVKESLIGMLYDGVDPTAEIDDSYYWAAVDSHFHHSIGVVNENLEEEVMVQLLRGDKTPIYETLNRVREELEYILSINSEKIMALNNNGCYFSDLYYLDDTGRTLTLMVVTNEGRYV